MDFKYKLLLFVTGALFYFHSDVTSAKPKKKVPEKAQEIPESEEALELPDLNNILNSTLFPQDACTYQSIGEVGGMSSIIGEMQTSVKGIKNHCTPKKFFKFVCDGKRHGLRQRRASLEYQALEAGIIIEKMNPRLKEKAKDQLALFLAQDQVPHNKTFGDFLRTDPLTYDDYKDALSKTSEVEREKKLYEALQSEQYVEPVRATLNSLKQNFMDALEQQKTLTLLSLPAHDLQSSQNVNLIFDAFDRMKEAVEKIEIDENLAKSVCVKDQRNAIAIRRPDGSTKIVVCPATIISGNIGEIAGTLAQAMASSIDSCAMDTMTVGTPEFSLSQVFEPLRTCLGSEISQNQGNRSLNVLPNIQGVPTPGKAVTNDPQYLAAIQASKSGKGYFEMLSVAKPHCPKPLSSEETRRMQVESRSGEIKDRSTTKGVNQRDQSNAAVARFFANKALAEYLKEHQQSKVDYIREAFAPYCDQIYHARGMYPKAEQLLNNIVSVDPDLRAAMGCNVNLKRAHAATVKTAKALIQQRKKNPKSTALTSRTSCDAYVPLGFADYFKKMEGPPAIQMSFQNNENAESISEKYELKADKKPEKESSKASAEPIEKDSSRGLKSKKSNKGFLEGKKNSNDSTRLHSAHYEEVEEALDSVREECMHTISALSEAQEQSLVQSACLQTKASRIDLPFFQNARPVKTASGSVLQVHCQARCLCDASRCFFPEPTYLGQTEPVISSQLTQKNIQQDLKYYLYANEPVDRYSLAAKECFKKLPSQMERTVAQQCEASRKSIVRFSGPQVSMIGETSQALLEMDCTFECSCSDRNDCRAQPVVKSNAQPQAVDLNAPEVQARIARGEYMYLSSSTQGIPHFMNEQMVSKISHQSEAGFQAERPPYDHQSYSDQSQGSAASAIKLVHAEIDSDLPEEFAHRNQVKLNTEEAAIRECRKVLGKPVQDQEALMYDYYCANKNRGEVAKEFLIEKQNAMSSGPQKAYRMSYVCSYVCDPKQKMVVQYAGQKFLPPSKPIDLSTPEAQEYARAADWKLYSDRADSVCNSLVQDPRNRDTVHLSVKSSCEASGNQGKTIIQEDAIRALDFKADLSNAYLRFSCEYHCVCQSPYLCNSAKAIPLRPENLEFTLQDYDAYSSKNQTMSNSPQQQRPKWEDSHAKRDVEAVQSTDFGNAYQELSVKAIKSLTDPEKAFEFCMAYKGFEISSQMQSDFENSCMRSGGQRTGETRKFRSQELFSLKDGLGQNREFRCVMNCQCGRSLNLCTIVEDPKHAVAWETQSEVDNILSSIPVAMVSMKKSAVKPMLSKQQIEIVSQFCSNGEKNKILYQELSHEDQKACEDSGNFSDGKNERKLKSKQTYQMNFDGTSDQALKYYCFLNASCKNKKIKIKSSGFTPAAAEDAKIVASPAVKPSSSSPPNQPAPTAVNPGKSENKTGKINLSQDQMQTIINYCQAGNGVLYEALSSADQDGCSNSGTFEDETNEKVLKSKKLYQWKFADRDVFVNYYCLVKAKCEDKKIKMKVYGARPILNDSAKPEDKKKGSVKKVEPTRKQMKELENICENAEKNKIIFEDIPKQDVDSCLNSGGFSHGNKTIEIKSHLRQKNFSGKRGEEINYFCLLELSCKNKKIKSQSSGFRVR